jgi:prolyl-tRNA synthetase
MFADLELLGIPLRVTVGDRGLKDGKVELQGRRETAPTAVDIADITRHLRERLGH